MPAQKTPVHLLQLFHRIERARKGCSPIVIVQIGQHIAAFLFQRCVNLHLICNIYCLLLICTGYTVTTPLLMRVNDTFFTSTQTTYPDSMSSQISQHRLHSSVQCVRSPFIQLKTDFSQHKTAFSYQFLTYTTFYGILFNRI